MNNTARPTSSASHSVSASLLDLGSHFNRGTAAAEQSGAQATRAAVRREYPGTRLPGWSVPYVLRVPALELGHPVLLFVLVKPNDAPLRYHPDRLGADGRGRRANLRWVTSRAATVRTGRRPPMSLTLHWCNLSPPIPSGLSLLCWGPAAYPSSDIAILKRSLATSSSFYLTGIRSHLPACPLPGLRAGSANSQAGIHRCQ